MKNALFPPGNSPLLGYKKQPLQGFKFVAGKRLHIEPFNPRIYANDPKPKMSAFCL